MASPNNYWLVRAFAPTQPMDHYVTRDETRSTRTLEYDRIGIRNASHAREIVRLLRGDGKWAEALKIERRWRI